MTCRWRTILAIDHDPKAVEVYRANIDAERIECGEITGFGLPEADVVLGGPPCQPFSHAGKREGSADARDCVPDFIWAIKTARPRMFLMEQVPGFATFEDGRYMQRTVQELSRIGYAVDARKLDAVNFGVPQFRERWWFWGIRNDIHGEIVRGPMGALHCWPKPTHVWPWPDQACMFGQVGGVDLLPAVVLGQALELDGWIKRPRQTGAREIVGTDEPMQALSSTRTDENRIMILTNSRGGFRGTASAHTPFYTSTRPARVITSQPHEYRWSDAMREKHPPASPASPAPTVQAKWYKGGAEGLVAVIGGKRRGGPGHDVEDRDLTGEPAQTIGDLSHGLRNGELRASEPPPTLAGDSRHTLTVRRLTPDECARLQSLPDDFIWPESIAKTHRYRIIGNGWASLMARRMSEALAAADPKSRTVIDLFCGGGCGAVGWHGRAWEYRQSEGRIAI